MNIYIYIYIYISLEIVDYYDLKLKGHYPSSYTMNQYGTFVRSMTQCHYHIDCQPLTKATQHHSISLP